MADEKKKDEKPTKEEIEREKARVEAGLDMWDHGNIKPENMYDVSDTLISYTIDKLKREKKGPFAEKKIDEPKITPMKKKRIEQDLQIDPFKLGDTYSREDIANRGGVPPLQDPREWTGIVPFKNCILLFVTLDKSRAKDEHKYRDEFVGPEFHWDSQASNTTKTPIIRRLKNSSETVLLFARISDKVKNKTQPFTYCGHLGFITSFGQSPVRFHWKLSDFPLDIGSTPSLDALAKWCPGSTSEQGKPKIPQNTSYSEGATTIVKANRYERDPRARQECIDYYGTKCWVCDFDYHECYGPIGSQYIEVHHRIPIAERAQAGGYELDPIKDLCPLCANCHRMVHRKAGIAADTPGSLQEPAWKKLIELRAIASRGLWEQIDD